MTSINNGTTRRSVLKAGTIASLALAGLPGMATAKSNGKGKGGGGRGFITNTAEELLDGPFTITGEVANPNWNPTGIAPSCNGNADLQDHVPYQTDVQDTDRNVNVWIFFPADRNVNTDVEYEIVTYEMDCSDVGDGRTWTKVVTKPA